LLPLIEFFPANHPDLPILVQETIFINENMFTGDTMDLRRLIYEKPEDMIQIGVDFGGKSMAGARGTVGIGTPGSISPRTRLMRNANSVWLNGRDLNADLSAALKRPVRIANDANCLALSEVVDGAAAGSNVAVRGAARLWPIQ
jgi:hypothetical protein